MRLKDLVANSLPRMRGRKKKSSAAAVAAVTEDPHHQQQTQHHHGKEIRDAQSGQHSIPIEPDWRGENALYRGPGREIEFMDTTGPRMMSHSYSAHGMVTSHSAEGLSKMMMLSRSYQSGMGMPGFSGRTSSNIALVEESPGCPVVLYESQRQQYNCYLHRHDHQHHHHYHHHHHHGEMPPPPTTYGLSKSFGQNIQTCVREDCSQLQSAQPKSGNQKQSSNFFRRSLASFRSMRRHSAKSSKENVRSSHNCPDASKCSICPYPETPTVNEVGEAVGNEKRPSKPKRKSFRSFTKSKEHRSKNAFRDKMYSSDNEMHQHMVPMVTCDNSGPYHVAMEIPNMRECSIESRSSRFYSSRESSCVRDFDTGSLSGYESDFTLGSKVHRSRSRIKTNPWLPSPQPSLAGDRRAGSCDLRESNEDLALQDTCSRSVPRSASFEYQRQPLTALPIDLDMGNSGKRSFVQRNRSFKPIDLKLKEQHRDLMIPRARTQGSPAPVKEKVIIARQSQKTSKEKSPETLNDLNLSLPRSRPVSIVSPNSEFVTLADNIEQLANNISFEYEDMLDSTLESVSLCQEDGKASITELVTDEDENGSGAGKRKQQAVATESANNSPTLLLLSGKPQLGPVTNAYSPDSGVGGLGPCDGDDMSCSPSRHADSSLLLPDSAESPPSKESVKHKLAEGGRKSISPVLAGNGHARRGKLTIKAKDDTGKDQQDIAGSHSSNTQRNMAAMNSMSKVEDGMAICESDVDNTTYLDTFDETLENAQFRPTNFDKAQTPSFGCEAESMMVNERLDTPFCLSHNPRCRSHISASEHHRRQQSLLQQQQHERHSYPSSSIVMGARISMQETAISPSPNQPKRMSDPVSHVNKQITCPGLAHTKLARPCTLNPSNQTERYPSKRSRTPLNDMERNTSLPGAMGSNNGERPWSGEFDIPRNIILSDTIESPTENSYCGESLLAGASQRREPRLTHSTPVVSRNNSEAMLRSDETVPAELLVVDLPKTSRCKQHQRQQYQPNQQQQQFHHHHHHQQQQQQNQRQHQHHQKHPKAEDGNSAAFEERTERRSVSTMSNASCQTEFLDDFTLWGQVSSAASQSSDPCGLAGKDFDAIESTRLWLLTGNMQGSADTGYSSLARDSRVFSDGFSDEDTSALSPGGVMDGDMRKGLHFNNDHTLHSPGNQPTESNRGLAGRSGYSDSKFNQQAGTIVTTDKKGEFKFRKAPGNTSTKRLYPLLETDSCKDETGFQCEHQPKGVPPDKVSEMFSNIDNQFQEIFLQIYKQQQSIIGSTSSLPYSRKSDTPTSNTHCGHAIGKNSSVDQVNDESSMSSLPNSQRARSEPPQGKFYDHTYENVHGHRATSWCTNTEGNIGSSNESSNNSSHQASQVRRNRSISDSYEDIWKASSHSVTEDSLGFEHCNESPKAMESTIAPVVEDNSPHYLKFLRDAPLRSKHSKHSLFLVPGVGPVDMASSEQMDFLFDILPPPPPPPSTPQMQLAFNSSVSELSKRETKDRSSPLTLRGRGKHPVTPTPPNSSSLSPSSVHGGNKKFKLKKGGQITMPNETAKNKDDENTILCCTEARGGNSKVSNPAPNGVDAGTDINGNVEPFYVNTHPQSQPPLSDTAASHCTTKLNDSACGTPPPCNRGPSQLALEGTSGHAQDDETRTLAQRVVCLRREKDVVYRKIKAAQEEEMKRQGQRLQLQREIHVNRKEALLETLHELKVRLEEQSRQLQLQTQQEHPHYPHHHLHQHHQQQQQHHQHHHDFQQEQQCQHHPQHQHHHQQKQQQSSSPHQLTCKEQQQQQNKQSTFSSTGCDSVYSESDSQLQHTASMETVEISSLEESRDDNAGTTLGSSIDSSISSLTPSSSADTVSRDS